MNLEEEPESPTARAEAHFRQARSLLAAGRYAEAWPLWEARRHVSRLDLPNIRADFPEWFGEDLHGKRIVVCVEQGFGDQLMFGRFLPLLKARGARVALACHPGYMGRLFSLAGYEIEPLWTDRPLAMSDYWTLIGSLPLKLGSIAPVDAHYIEVPPIIGTGLGIKAQGSAAHSNDRNRSIPEPLASRLVRLGRNLDPDASGARDFLDTAAIIASLDLVISVDTSVAHLAGALGKPCWVLLPYEGLSWRWGGGSRSDWYPDFRLFRQPRVDDWGSVIDQVLSALSTL